MSLVYNKTRRKSIDKKRYKLRKYVEEVKILLSEAKAVNFPLESVYGDDYDRDKDLEVYRSDFEEANEHLFQKTIQITKKALKKNVLRLLNRLVLQSLI